VFGVGLWGDIVAALKKSAKEAGGTENAGWEPRIVDGRDIREKIPTCVHKTSSPPPPTHDTFHLRSSSHRDRPCPAATRTAARSIRATKPHTANPLTPS